MHIVIFANGVLEDPRTEVDRWVGPEDVIVGADGGTLHVLDAGLTPHHVVGDLDSLSEETLERLREAGVRIREHPPDKDETDLELALLWAAEHQPDAEILVLGVLGGRPDQTLANLLLLALPALEGREVRIIDDDWEVCLIRGGETLTLYGDVGDTVSLIPLGGDARGVTTSGLRYSLDQEVLNFGPARGVSNVLESAEAAVTVDEGLLWCFHRRNRVA